MVQLLDTFSKPEMSLIADLTDYLQCQNMDYEPESLYHDISKCIGAAHAIFHAETRANPQFYLHKDEEVISYLQMLHESGKKIFLR